MYMKNNHDLHTLYNHIDSDKKVYKNTLLSGVTQGIDYKLHKYSKLYKKALISELWLDTIDFMEWEELASINYNRWVENTKKEIGI